MSSSIKKVGNIASNIFSGLDEGTSIKTDTSSLEALIDFYKNQDTSKVDDIYDTFEDTATDVSGALSDAPMYDFDVEASEEARKRAEEATLNQYLNYLTPIHATQTDNLSTSLLNQGLSVGSEAYNRAMGNLIEEQNQSLNDAVYKSVLAGQDAYSNSLKDQINAGNYLANMRTDAIQEINALLKNSLTDEEKAQKIYEYAAGIAKQNALDEQNAYNNILNLAKTGANVFKVF